MLQLLKVNWVATVQVQGKSSLDTLQVYVKENREAERRCFVIICNGLNRGTAKWLPYKDIKTATAIEELPAKFICWNVGVLSSLLYHEFVELKKTKEKIAGAFPKKWATCADAWQVYKEEIVRLFRIGTKTPEGRAMSSPCALNALELRAKLLQTRMLPTNTARKISRSTKRRLRAKEKMRNNGGRGYRKVNYFLPPVEKQDKKPKKMGELLQACYEAVPDDSMPSEEETKKTTIPF